MMGGDTFESANQHDHAQHAPLRPRRTGARTGKCQHSRSTPGHPCAVVRIDTMDSDGSGIICAESLS